MTTYGDDSGQNIQPAFDDNQYDAGNNGGPPPYTVNDTNPYPDDDNNDNDYQQPNQEYGTATATAVEPVQVSQDTYQEQQQQQQPEYNDPQQNEYQSNIDYQENNNDNNNNNNDEYQQQQQPNNNYISTDYGANNDVAAAPAEDHIYADPEDVVEQTEMHDDGQKKQSKMDSGDDEYTPFFSDFVIRTLYISIMFFLFCICSLGYWTTDISIFDGPGFDTKDLEGAFSLTAAGNLFIFFGSLLAMVIAIFERCERALPFQQIFIYLTMGLYVLGGALYWFGGMAVAGAWNSLLEDLCKAWAKIDEDYEGYCSAFSGIWFVEGTLVGGFAIIFGVDIWKRFMSRVPLRIYVNLGLFSFICLVGFFCYAIVSTNMPEYKKNKKDNGATGTVAAGYFFTFIFIVIHLCLRFIPFLREKLKTPLFDLFFVIVFFLFGILLVVGYWALVGDVGGNAPLFGTGGNSKDAKAYDGAMQGYFVGISFIMLFMITFFACDMQLGKYLSRFASEPVAKSDQENNASVDDYGQENEYGQENQMYGDSQQNENGEEY